MKLAEALVNRSDLQRKIAQLKQRLERVVKVQEGEEPAEQPKDLLRELEHSVNELAKLVRAINRTNSGVAFDEHWTLADALAERDRMLQLRKLLNDLLEQASITQDRFSRSEVRYQRTVDVVQIQKQVDDLSRDYRELDFRIQEKNWTITLIGS
ncbi:DIP1984 family protein [Paenibacillus albidus]|uniref:DIP1984 family protein n=1 Tax=Paenibacillus albidus TaxID=2041023 RepID=UPI001BE57BE1|nr:DIP1984 family protein [Paenibacillus albidus]MBT2289559.1 DIP1984 family protein [Paenibacillus albidus]